jgi:hypothetical protein
MTVNDLIEELSALPAIDRTLTIGVGPEYDIDYDVAKLGYIKPDDLVLDMTYGEGVWWKVWRPDVLVALAPGVDFRATGYPDGMFDVVTDDAPYKLNGKPDPKVDARYGVHVRASMEDRHQLMAESLTEAARVVRPGGFVLFKCQDQVCLFKLRDQTRIFANLGEALGLTVEDRFDMTGQHRPQPVFGRRR